MTYLIMYSRTCETCQTRRHLPAFTKPLTEDSLDSPTFAKPFTEYSPDLLTFAKPFTEYSPDSPTFAKGHF